MSNQEKPIQPDDADIDLALEKALGASAPKAPYVYDYKAAPSRQVVMPKTVPLPGLRAYLVEKAALEAAEEAKWQKAQADYAAAKAKAEAEGAPEPKAPVKVLPKKDPDLTVPVPSEAKDPDLLRLMALLGDGVEEAFEQSGELTCQVARARILEALKLCREDAALKYEMLADETATHYPAAGDFAFSVVYHLTSISRRKRLRLRILVPEGFEPQSAVQVYPGANWLEREIFDMFGIRFQNHPDLVRILCPDDWEAHPLRKEYPVVGWGQRDIDFREDRSGMLNRIALEKAGQLGINLKRPKAE
ncbi:NADH-quinone oxidoreductase subunit C [Holophaga foetida]|uniref:NADH-quinone oxidoreductase subunit C n=1 Tax=Holophaga foetida TaxID=35839 RepID=UPI0002472192|nr:NADH-quinone oxidoreductase subunit C [Holophaga foetida]